MRLVLTLVGFRVCSDYPHRRGSDSTRQYQGREVEGRSAREIMREGTEGSDSNVESAQKTRNRRDDLYDRR